MNKNVIITKSKEETMLLGKNFGESLGKGDILVLFGDLGSGKTTFIQGLAKGLGTKKRIISPTFIIVRHYKIDGPKYFYHIDLYRTFSKNDLLGLGLDEILQDKDSIAAIEWGEKLHELMPKKRIEIYFESLSENERKISIEKYE